MAEPMQAAKEIWTSLKTSHLSAAEARLTEFRKEHRQRAANGNGEVSAKITFGEAASFIYRMSMTILR